MKYDQDLSLNFDLKKLLWQDELNPRVRCALGNVFLKGPAVVSAAMHMRRPKLWIDSQLPSLSIYICLINIDISFRSKSKEELNERQAAMSSSGQSNHSANICSAYQSKRGWHLSLS